MCLQAAVLPMPGAPTMKAFLPFLLLRRGAIQLAILFCSPSLKGRSLGTNSGARDSSDLKSVWSALRTLLNMPMGCV